MYDILTTNGVSDLCYENDRDLITWGVLLIYVRISTDIG